MGSQEDRQITNALVAVQRGDIHTWGPIGQLLSRVERTGYWRREAHSFTEWLTTHAPTLGYNESSLWRYLGASRLYEQLRARLAGDKIACLPLDQLSARGGPENLELLAKLTRAAPPDVVRDLEQRVVMGTVTRTELRNTWLAFRPVLGGQTARGRGVRPPHFNPADHQQVQSQLEGLIFQQLTSGDPRWVGCATPQVYELFLNVWPHCAAGARVSFDAVAVVREQSRAPLVFHGIEVGGAIGKRDDAYEARAPYCDALWLAVSEQPDHGVLKMVPPYVGILHIQEGVLVVDRPAIRGGVVGTKTGDMAKGVLDQCLHR